MKAGPTVILRPGDLVDWKREGTPGSFRCRVIRQTLHRVTVEVLEQCRPGEAAGERLRLPIRRCIARTSILRVERDREIIWRLGERAERIAEAGRS